MSAKTPIVVAVTGGAGQIAYSLLPPLLSGAVFGPDQPVKLHLLDIEPAMVALGGVIMECEDLAYPLYAGAIGTSDPNVAFKDAVREHHCASHIASVELSTWLPAV